MNQARGPGEMHHQPVCSLRAQGSHYNTLIQMRTKAVVVRLKLTQLQLPLNCAQDSRIRCFNFNDLDHRKEHFTNRWLSPNPPSKSVMN